MAVICFLDGGSASTSQFAARLVSRHSGLASGRIGYVSCCGGSSIASEGRANGSPLTSLSGRELIEEIRMLQSNHENVILDASGTNDQMIALAVALSDVVLTPFCLDEPNYEAFLHAIDLVRIVTANMRRGLNQWVYLTTRSESASTVVMVQVSGQLAMKGLGTLTVPLCGCNEGESECLERAGAADEHNHLVFANGVFDLIARRFAPIIRQRRFG